MAPRGLADALAVLIPTYRAGNAGDGPRHSLPPLTGAKGTFAWTLLLTGLAGVAAGCTPSVDNIDQIVEAQIAEADREAIHTMVVDASAETIASTGIAQWHLEVDDVGVVARGLDDGGVELGHVAIREWVEGESRGKEIVSSEGGLIRIDTLGEVTTLLHDQRLFAAFTVDTEELRAGLESESFRSCSALDWLLCGGKVLGVIAKCGPGAMVCAAKILGTGKCLDCFSSGGGGGGAPSVTGGGGCGSSEEPFGGGTPIAEPC